MKKFGDGKRNGRKWAMNEDKIRQWLKGIEYDLENRTLTAEEGDNHVASIRGWSAIRRMFATDQEAADFQDEVGEWIADAITKKLQAK
jgi:hypothetical protein